MTQSVLRVFSNVLALKDNLYNHVQINTSQIQGSQKVKFSKSGVFHCLSEFLFKEYFIKMRFGSSYPSFVRSCD
jgi:hypothetical protein